MNRFLNEYTMTAHPMMTFSKNTQRVAADVNPNITSIAWAMIIVLIVALKNRYITVLLNIYLICKLLYLYKALQYGKNNPGVVFIENLAYNMKVNTFIAMCVIYKIADDFMWRQVVEDFYNPEDDLEESSEEEDTDSSSDYEERVYKRPCIDEEDSAEDADDEADLSPLFTCKTCQITSRSRDYVFVVFCKNEYCFNCFTNVFYKTPMNEIVSYYLDENINNRDDGWYNPETGIFYTGFWLESQFIPKMSDSENITRYGESFIGGDNTLFRLKEEEDAESSEEEEDAESSEEEDNDSSSDYEEWVFKKVDSNKDATKYTCCVCEISTKNPYVEFVVFCGKEYCGTCYTKALYTTPLKEVDAYYLSEHNHHDGWYDPESKTFHIGFWGNYEFKPIMNDVRNIRRYSDTNKAMPTQDPANKSSEEEEYIPKCLFPQELNLPAETSSDMLEDTNGLSDPKDLPTETSSDDFADNDFTEHDFE